MGFQQELFEVDLERGDNVPTEKGIGGAFRAETTITYALILLVAAAVIRPTERVGEILAACSFGLSAAGAYVLVKRNPAAPHAKKVLIILATCWLLYGIRMVHLTSGATSVKNIIPSGVPRKIGAPPPPPLALPTAVGPQTVGSGGGKKVGPVQHITIQSQGSHKAHRASDYEMVLDGAKI